LDGGWEGKVFIEGKHYLEGFAECLPLEGPEKCAGLWPVLGNTPVYKFVL
jgi:hypothetical protein